MGAMSADVSLYLGQPGAQNHMAPCVGQIVVRGVSSSGQTHRGQQCLDLEVEALPPNQQLTVERDHVQTPLTVGWLQLNVELRTNRIPQRTIGRVLIDDAGMLPIGPSRSGPARWLWELLPEDVEQVEMARAVSPTAPIYFQVDVRGIAKLFDPNGSAVDVVSIRGATSQLVVELSQWERLLQQLDYSLPPSHPALAGLPSLEHPSWKDATTRLNNARSHHRSGEDYDALRECLSALEAVVHAPYHKESWKQQLASLPEQKAEGIAELFSGIATYCNRVGHHRGRKDRNVVGDLSPMPLDHWEADLVVGAAQFVLTYAIRLRSAGMLVESSPPAETTDASPSTETSVR